MKKIFNGNSLSLILLFITISTTLSSLTPPTPHIAAAKGDFAKTVLMPGDPKRSEYMVKKYLQNAKLVNDVRGVQGYTGEYKGHKVSIMASGMGCPSIGIYSYELYSAFGVENIIRVGSAGAIGQDLNVKDILVATGACTNSNYGASFGIPGIISAVASYDILKKIDETKKKLGYSDSKVKFQQVLTSDTFYTDIDQVSWTKAGVGAVEMETYALYLNAARAGKRAATICTISDHIVKGDALSAEERQTSFHEMMVLALETAISLD